LDNLKLENKSYFFASNHASALDIPLAFAGIPIWLVSIAKIELKSIPVLGWVMTTAGHVFVDRKNKEKAFLSLENAKKTFTKNPRSVLIFPEGTRTRNGELMKFKTGGLKMAIDLGIPIVPVACKGTYEMLKNGSRKIGNNKLELKIGVPILTKIDEKLDKKDVAKIIKKSIEKLLSD
jgi:1-acyl-sn-glycerol-3-phosphate acyltransferase